MTLWSIHHSVDVASPAIPMRRRHKTSTHKNISDQERYQYKREVSVHGEKKRSLSQQTSHKCRYRRSIDSVSWKVKHRSSNNNSSCTFEIAIIEQGYYRIYRRLKSKRVSYLGLYCVRCINRPALVFCSVELGKFILHPLWNTTHKLDSANKSIPIRLFYFSYGIQFEREMLLL